MSGRAMFVCSDRTLATASLVNSIDLDNHCYRVQMFQDCLTTISISIVIWLRGWFVHGQPAQLFVGSLKVEEIRPTHLGLPPAHLSPGHGGLEVAEASLHQPRPHSHALPSHTTQTQGWSEPLEGGSTTGPASTAARAGLRETGSGLGGTPALAARTKLVSLADDRGRDLETQQLVVPASLAIKASQSLKPPNILLSPTSSTIYFREGFFQATSEGQCTFGISWMWTTILFRIWKKMNLFYGISILCCIVCRICGHQICYHFRDDVEVQCFPAILAVC